MASNNRVFVSPGVYTSEQDLTLVAQSVGVTTLGNWDTTIKAIEIGSTGNFYGGFNGTTKAVDKGCLYNGSFTATPDIDQSINNTYSSMPNGLHQSKLYIIV